MVTKKENKQVFIRELSVRYKKRRVPKKTNHYIGKVANNPRVIANLFKDIQREAVEKCFVIHLNASKIIESFQLVSMGTLFEALVSPRDVFKGALLSNAAHIIFVHNHPSGNPKPSDADRLIVKKMEAVGEIISIEVVDHIIIGIDSYYSIKQDRASHF